AGNPEASAISFDSVRGVAQDLDAARLQNPGDKLGIESVIMIAQNREQRITAAYVGKEFGTRGDLLGFSCPDSRDVNQRSCNKVTREHDEISIEAVYHLDCRLDRGDGKNGIVVKIAQLRDGESVEFPGQPA